MNQLKKTLTLIILLIAFANNGQSPICYEVIADMSGFDMSLYQTELESVAYTSTQTSEWYIEMRDSNPNPFTCISK